MPLAGASSSEQAGDVADQPSVVQQAAQSDQRALLGYVAEDAGDMDAGTS